MKRPIITERMFLYWTDREHPNTCRMTVRMQEAIKLTMMQEALRQTQTRYPYYSVRLKLTSDEHGRRPIRVSSVADYRYTQKVSCRSIS